MEKQRVIYVIRHRETNRVYVGQKTFQRQSQFERYWGSGDRIKRAIVKYGTEAFDKTILEYCDSIESTNEAEVKWIIFYDAINKGFNLVLFPKITKEGIENAAKFHHTRKGIKFSEEHKQKISNANKGKKHSEEHTRKVGLAQRGKIISEEAKKKISLKMKGKK